MRLTSALNCLKKNADITESYYSLAVTHLSLGNFDAALDSKQHALDIRLKLFGEQHAVTAKSYYSFGATHL